MESPQKWAPWPKEKKYKKQKVDPDPKRKMNIFFIGYILYPFRRKNPAKCPLSENIKRYAPVLKHNFLKMEIQCKTQF